MDEVGKNIVEKEDDDLFEMSHRKVSGNLQGNYHGDDERPVMERLRNRQVDLDETNENLMDDAMNYPDIPELNNQNLNNFNPTELIKNDPSL